MTDNAYKELSKERKELQAQGKLPEWFTTGGWQLFKAKYAVKGEEAFYGRAKTIAETAAKHMGPYKVEYEQKFFDLIWKGWLSCSTPVLANMGTTRGMPVSCSGGVVEDSIDGFYSSLRNQAMLTKNGFGTSVYLGDIRPRGTPIKSGGSASGIIPVLQDHVEMSRKVSQGGVRRGAIANYIPVDHGDFHECVKYLIDNQDDLNIGWVITDKFIEKLQAGDEDAADRFSWLLYAKMITGKGYFWFVDKANRRRPEAYVRNGLFNKASNLCSEIALFSDKDHDFTCVLSSMNASLYSEWKDTDAIFTATVFLDCVAEEFIQRAEGIPGLEKAIRFTKKGRALGLGVAGFHTYLLKNMIPYESLEAHMFNNTLFKQLNDQSLAASQWMAKEFGEPEWCKGLGERNTHRIAVAPTKSTAQIMGGISEGINQEPAMTYTGTGAAGEIERVNGVLVELMKKKGVHTKKNIQAIIDDGGSVQGVDWLTEEEKLVFKGGFETNQEVGLRMASARGRYIDQWQSYNSYIKAETPAPEIRRLFQKIFLDPTIVGHYYIYSKAGVRANTSECLACQ